MNAPYDPKVTYDIEKNPLVSYLKIFQNQHKIITILYRGLIFSFGGFITLLSLLVFSIFDNDLIPIWGTVSLVVIDALLLLGVVKAFQELKRYRKRSIGVLEQVYDYLKNDLMRLEKIKSEHAIISETHKKIQNKILSFSSKSKKPGIEDYQGWDNKVCPKCHTSVEMMIEVCPQCHHSLGTHYAS